MIHRHVGIYAGSFDPLHEGHLAFARAALNESRLDEVYLLPEPNPRSKPDVSPVGTRIEKIRERIALDKGFGILETPFETYTAPTLLPYLHNRFPGAKLSLLVGSDIVLGHLLEWDNIETIAPEVQFIVGLRKGDPSDEVNRVMKRLGARYQIVTTRFSHLSSTGLKEKTQV